MTIWKSKCGLMELRLGDYRVVLDDVKECQSVITDPPYSKRTHEGQNVSRDTSYDLRAATKQSEIITQISYPYFSVSDVNDLVVFFSSRIEWWICAMSDHCLHDHYVASSENNDLYAFHPIPCVISGMTVRLSGDGPSSWAVYLNVSRRRRREIWGTLQGAYWYSGGQEDRRIHIGGKPLLLMRQIVRDYSRKGALVVDPCAGAATTLLACAIEGRRCIGAEIDGETFEKAIKRLEKGYTPLLME